MTQSNDNIKLTSIVGCPQWVVYRSNDFSIQKIKMSDGRQYTVKGYNLPSDKYSYTYTGKIINDKKHGESLDVHFCALYVNNEKDAIKYLTSHIQGIGIVTAKRFYDKYGVEVFKAIRNFDEVRTIVKSDKRAIKISESAKLSLVDPEKYELISKYQIKPIVLNKLNYSLEEIKENPFILQGYVPFFKMNRMAIDFGSNLKSYDRIKNAVLYILNETISSSGHLFCHYDQLFNKTLELLNSNVYDKKVNKEILSSAMKQMYNSNVITLKKQGTAFIVYSTRNYIAEQQIAEKLINLILNKKESFSQERIDKAILLQEKALNIELAEKQKVAVEMVINNNISIITGSAGTGKTTVLRACMGAFQNLTGCEETDILLLAPTGRAAQRMSESTGHPAQTVHSKLGLDEEGEVKEIITEKIVFIDEMSMTDNRLLSIIFNNTHSSDTKFVFLGDPNQLPSVGAGNVLEDCISSGIIPTTKLNVIHRQAENSLIIKNALNILKGNSLINKGNDFAFIETKDIYDETIKAFVEEYNLHSKNVMAVQIIVPMKTRGDYCQEKLNNGVQSVVNPICKGDLTISMNNNVFHKGDKVICQKNTEKVKNGDIGIITDVYTDEDGVLSTIIEFYGKYVVFTAEQLRDLKFCLAYAITIHKSQGSEFPSVIMPVGNDHILMLQRNLMYTAVTRASTKMTLVGDTDCYKTAVVKNEKKKRNTGLKQQMLDLYSKSL